MLDNKKKKTILIIISLLVVLLIILMIWLASAKKTENDKTNSADSNNIVLDTRTDEEKKDDLIKKLKRSSESERIRIYLGTYFNYIEDKDYESAYNLLYPDFKNNYFKTLDEFEDYIKEQNFPEIMSISYDDISMQGEYYIVTVKIGDFLTKSSTTARKMNLIVKENDYNDYYISFQK